MRRIRLAISVSGDCRRRSPTLHNHSSATLIPYPLPGIRYLVSVAATTCPTTTALDTISPDEQVETFEDGFVVSDYAKMFEKKRPLNGNTGMWDWGMTKLFGSTHPQVTRLICHAGQEDAPLS